jgi:hypothetical protein
VNYDLVKKGQVVVGINPEPVHTFTHFQQELEMCKRGPGAYYPSFKEIEKRDDAGVFAFNKAKKIQEIVKEEAQIELNPNYDFDKENKLVFKYSEPAEVNPPHLPSKYFKPENWEFHQNIDMPNDNAKNDFASNMELDQFQKHVDFALRLYEFF